MYFLNFVGIDIKNSFSVTGNIIRVFYNIFKPIVILYFPTIGSFTGTSIYILIFHDIVSDKLLAPWLFYLLPAIRAQLIFKIILVTVAVQV